MILVIQHFGTPIQTNEQAIAYHLARWARRELGIGNASKQNKANTTTAAAGGAGGGGVRGGGEGRA